MTLWQLGAAWRTQSSCLGLAVMPLGGSAARVTPHCGEEARQALELWVGMWGVRAGCTEGGEELSLWAVCLRYQRGLPDCPGLPPALLEKGGGGVGPALWDVDGPVGACTCHPCVTACA